MQQWLYVLHPERPAMLVSGPTPAEREILSRHAAHCEGLAARGVMLVVGRTQTTTPETLGLVVFVAEDEAAARATMESDPAVIGKVMRAELFPYKVSFGNVEGFREALDAAG